MSAHNNLASVFINIANTSRPIQSFFFPIHLISDNLPLIRTFFRLLFIVVQFHLLFLNWNWHSLVPISTPLTISSKRALSLQITAICPRSRRVFLHTSSGFVTTRLPTALKQNEKKEKTNYFSGSIEPTKHALTHKCIDNIKGPTKSLLKRSFKKKKKISEQLLT